MGVALLSALVSTPTRGIRAGCCAAAGSGASVAAKSRKIKSRRLICPPRRHSGGNGAAPNLGHSIYQIGPRPAKPHSTWALSRFTRSRPPRFLADCRMLKIPIRTLHSKVPAGPDWLHEIKHDGYRLIVQREGKRVRLFTRNGHDWTTGIP